MWKVLVLASGDLVGSCIVDVSVGGFGRWLADMASARLEMGSMVA